MAYDSLKQAVIDLEQRGELVRIKTPVSTVLEITEIIDRLVKSETQNKAVLFENTGTDFPLLINLFGSKQRMEAVLGVSQLDDIANEILHIFEKLTTPPSSFFDKLKLLPQLKALSQWMPHHKKGRGEAQAIVMQEPDLRKLPILTCWPADAAPFITLPSVHTQSPDGKERNVGMYRMQVLDEKTTAMHWHMHKGGAAHYDAYKQLNRKMPVAVTLGGDPIYTYVATAPLPDGVDEYILAGFLRKKRVEMVRCLTQDIEVPADVDIVIEGYIDTQEPPVEEGPFGDHTGYYSLPDTYPKFHITAITHRRNAIYPTTVVGIPPQEDAWIGKATERIFLPLLQLSALPELVNMNMPFWGVAHNLVIVSAKSRVPGVAHKIAHQFWGAGQMAFNKILIVVDETVPVHDMKQVLRAVVSNVSIATDVMLSQGMLDVLDHATEQKAFGGKLLIDATKKNIEQKNETLILQESSMAHQKIEKAYVLLNQEIIFLQVKDHLNISELDTIGLSENCKTVIQINTEINPHEPDYLLWQILNNIDIDRDVQKLKNGNLLFVDATHKAGKQFAYGHWPNMLKMQDDIIRLVDKKWEQYGFGKAIESPSKRFSFLKNISDDSAYYDNKEKKSENS